MIKKIYYKGVKAIFYFFSVLFSVKSYNETHIIIYFLGIKIKFPKIKYYILKKQNPYYKYKKIGYDIKKLPHAEGFLRELQLANLVLLNELDYVCAQNNLLYWLDGGTLLGSVRHKGYIPWDDDIDVGMLIDDYERVISAFEKSSKDKDIFACYTQDNKHPDNCIIKVKHKRCPTIFIDIFPFYLYGKSLTLKEQIEKTKEIKKIRKKELCNVNKFTSNEELKTLHSAIMKKYIIQSNISEHQKDVDIVWGIQYNHQWKNWFEKYNTVFPLKPIIFEGREYMGINNPDAYLARIYGNYMSYPSKITFGHNAYKKLDDNEYSIIKEYARKQKQRL